MIIVVYEKAPDKGCSFNCKITIGALRIALPRLEELFDDAIFLSSLEVVFVWFHMDSEQAGVHDYRAVILPTPERWVSLCLGVPAYFREPTPETEPSILSEA